ncbi:hypothetical protein FRX31_012126 [Thalictrum thalictroides]|uniref:Uncharacterized protein n=1 Tax=Thalictrum thalictroides TaxID=46969 RepID=A0A7J6WMX9_THATH|nr:hypothetical protein FRX31_012126 [Thalictrum thalictroides]
MRPPQILVAKPSASLVIREWPCSSTLSGNRVCKFWRLAVRFSVCKTYGSMPTNSTVPITASDVEPDLFHQETHGWKWGAWEEDIEKVIYGCRFLTFFAVLGSLVGSILCFVKGCTYVATSFVEYFVTRGKATVLTLVEAIDIYLLGTVMLVFGMGLYELFVSNLEIATTPENRSNLFGLFTLKERPRWLEIKSLNELKTKLGHVIVMVLLVGLLEKTRRVEITSTMDLLCFSASILISSGCLYLLSKLTK